MSNRRHDDASPAGARGVAGPLCRGARGVLTLGLLAGTAACSSAPQYPIYEGERAGNGTMMAVQPRYAVSAQDAAQNAADRQAQAGYPSYTAPPMAEPAAPTPGAAPYGDASPPAAPAPGADDMADDAPRALAPSGGGVDSADLPPPGAAPPATANQVPPVPADPGAGAVPPADPAASPHEIAYPYGGGQVVFGMDWVMQPPLELAAYRHRRHAAAAETAGSAKSGADDTAETAAASSRRRRRHGAATAEGDDAASVAETRPPAADTPYQTVVKPGETLGEVAERIHSSRAALTALNDLKHPKHVRPGTVLKIPYRYSYEVQKGDTLYTIAHRFNQAPEQIAKLNGLKAIPTLQPGQSIQLPPDADDQGKRDHASASGPEPVAAPEKVADAALRKVEKTERRTRRSRAAELNSAEASLPPQEVRHGRGRGETSAEASAQPSSLPSPPSVRPTGTAASSEPVAIPPPVTPTEVAPARATTTAAAPVQTPRALAPAPVAARPYATTPSPAYASRAAVPAAGAAVVAASGGSTLSRPSAVAPSTYTAPGYAARSVATPPAASQYASAAPPRYTPGYPATGGAAAGSYTPSLGRERPAAPALSGGAATAADIASAGRGRFIWPLRGPVVSGFGAKGTGEYNNGVDISAQPGTGVRAAASGDVVYAGSSIPGYGNMVLIKHPGGWVTAYAHLNRIEVRMHDTVSQGDEIGQAGQTGVVDRPELYFEVRYAASAADRPRPVDPALVLPAGGG